MARQIVKGSEEQALLTRADQLRADFHAQTARIDFAELQRPFAAGRVVLVSDGLDLVEVAVALALDDRELFETWIKTEEVAAPGDARAREWLQQGCSLWAVVANPWVLVQQRLDS